MPRILIAVLIVICLFAAFDRGERVHYGYTGGAGGLIVAILVLGLLLGWFRF